MDAKSNNSIKIPKKRGRKPKNIKPIENKSEVKKRGRKPKDKVYSVNDNLNNLSDLNDNIILHIPIKSIDTGNIQEMNQKITEKDPEPFEPNNNFSHIESYSNNINSNNINSNNINCEPVSCQNEIIQDTAQNINKKLLDTNYEFIDSNKRCKWLTNTGQYCLWCCHSFETTPIPLPLKKARR